MKRKILGLAIVALAITCSAFEARPAAKQGTSLFWFLTDPAQGVPYASTTLIYQFSDPWNCTATGLGGYCAGGFTSYTGTGPYFADGWEARIDYERLP